MTEAIDNIRTLVVGWESPYHETKVWNFDVHEYLRFLFESMVNYDASDLYLTFWETPVYRIYWETLRVQGLAKLDDNMLKSFWNLLIKTDADKDLFQKNMSVDLWVSLNGRRYRVNVSKQRTHLMVVARLLAEKVPTIDSLWLPQIFKALMNRTSGLIFVAWPTGSWKSTTLAAMVEEVNMYKHRHIITIEDPIEYMFNPQNCIFEQKQLWRDITSFASAMKYALRQRPDIILFWEARDPESLENAMALAETGHLVITTIHSRSVEQTVNKIISMFPTDKQDQIRNNLSENLVAIIVQKLLKRKDWNGMVPAHEIVLNNTAIENAIREDKLNQIDNVISTNRAAWMQLLDDDLAKLVIEWKVDLQDTVEHVRDMAHFRDAISNAWISFQIIQNKIYFRKSQQILLTFYYVIFSKILFITPMIYILICRIFFFIFNIFF